mmetsp:Transcript_41479/g.67323  ORF Transcript_41479/g.67323 Transcript_41479/m.67323 type:complete len:463 (-) Transcript_41479:926-2314(-)|eukprot:CAMPEP_0184651588 /NCGR_PEP_ID=MMETSP0308-20130426/9232_1 /TAXON_ID=38269 /ORGANISM="Gloeochaete witrockiana, Strain SAG 46.84" /LENGTH=462 /DNA_ID=CAMNT_0027085931 /DNA_START=224 /DNA_END=1612 /DNA_ORIENTATION=-
MQEVVCGPRVRIDLDRLSISCAVGVLAKGSITVFNIGTTALYYAWKKFDLPRLLGTTNDGCQRFFLTGNDNGSILPHQSKEFVFSFRSSKAGMFTEAWELRFTPEVPGATSPHLLTCRGTATSEDASRLQRRLLEEHLTKNQTLHTIEDILGEILQNVRTPPRVPTPVEVDSQDEENEQLFNAQNRDLKLWYHVDVFIQLCTLAQSTFAFLNFPPEDSRWDYSVTSLSELIVQIADEDERTQYLAQLNELVKYASVPPSSSALFYSIGYELWVEVLESIPDASALLRRQLGLSEAEFIAPPLLEEERVPDQSRKGRRATAPSPTPSDDALRSSKSSPSPAKPKTPAGGAPSKAGDEGSLGNTAKTFMSVRTMRKASQASVVSSAKPTHGDRSKKKSAGGDDQQSPRDEDALAEATEDRRKLDAQYIALFTSKFADMIGEMSSRFEVLCDEAGHRSRQPAKSD